MSTNPAAETSTSTNKVKYVLVPSGRLLALRDVLEDATVGGIALTVDKDGHFTLWLTVDATPEAPGKAASPASYIQVDMEHKMVLVQGSLCTYGKLAQTHRKATLKVQGTTAAGEEFKILSAIRVHPGSGLTYRSFIDMYLKPTLSKGFYQYAPGNSNDKNESVGCNVLCLHLLYRLSKASIISGIEVGHVEHAMNNEAISKRHTGTICQLLSILLNNTNPPSTTTTGNKVSIESREAQQLTANELTALLHFLADLKAQPAPPPVNSPKKRRRRPVLDTQPEPEPEPDLDSDSESDLLLLPAPQSFSF